MIRFSRNEEGEADHGFLAQYHASCCKSLWLSMNYLLNPPPSEQEQRPKRAHF
jgi:hypothetical protein